MTALQIIQVVMLGLACVLFAVAGLYLIRAGRYNKSTAAYWRAHGCYSKADVAAGDQEYAEASRLKTRAEQTFRWLP